jgi:hypothetical protein
MLAGFPSAATRANRWIDPERKLIVVRANIKLLQEIHGAKTGDRERQAVPWINVEIRRAQSSAS